MIETDAEYFDATATLECGQVFRFRKRERDYELYAGASRAILRTENGRTYVCTDDRAFFEQYFDLNRDYAAVVRACSAFPEAAEAVYAGRGIRILNQPLFECVVDSIVSANNNIPRIQGIIGRLCDAYGKDMGGYRAFPTPEDLKDVTVDDYRRLGAGYRDQYLFATARAALETDVLDRVRAADTAEAGRLLCSLKGVGRKVADCILLFGLHRGDVYPTDTWIFKAHRSETLDTPEKVRAYCLARYGEYAGYVQQYIFYSQLRNKPREKKQAK